MVKNFFILALILFEMSCSSSVYNRKAVPNVGSAEITTDGILTLNLIGRDSEGNIVHAIKSYAPGDPFYEEVKQHIGDIKPGERKVVSPWPN